jgi:hypothetical protein
MGHRARLRIVLFKAYSAFTRVTGLHTRAVGDTHSEGFSYVTSRQLRLHPAGAVVGWEARLAMGHAHSGSSGGRRRVRSPVAMPRRRADSTRRYGRRPYRSRSRGRMFADMARAGRGWRRSTNHRFKSRWEIPEAKLRPRDLKGQTGRQRRSDTQGPQRRCLGEPNRCVLRPRGLVDLVPRSPSGSVL